MADTTQDVLIKVKADATPIKAFNAEIRKTKEEVAKASLEFGKQSKEFENASNKLKSLQTGFANLKKTVTEAGNSVKLSKFQLMEFGENLTVVGAGISAVVSRVSAFVSQAMTLGSSLTVLQSNFKGTAQDLELFRLATAGTVTDANLIKLSNQARDLGISLDKQAILFSLAEDAGDKYGGSVEDNIQRVILAIAKNGRGLEQLGITTAEYKKITEELTKAQGLTADTMTEEERIAIGFEAIMKITGMTLSDVTGKTQDVADKMESLKVQQTEITTAFGQGINVVFEETYNLASDLVKSFNEMTGSALKVTEAAKILGEAVTSALISPLLGLKKLIDEINSNPLLSMALNGIGRGGGSTGEVFGGSPLLTQNPAIGAIGRGDNKAQQAIFVAEKSDETLQDTQTIFGAVSQTMSLIGITTDSFLGKLVGGFGTVLTIMESIKAVNSILSFIPGFAAGGTMSGVSWVGEQGKELMFNPGAYIMSHSDSMKFVNQNNSSGSNVNVYLAGNIDVTAALKKENKKYRYITVKQ